MSAAEDLHSSLPVEVQVAISEALEEGYIYLAKDSQVDSQVREWLIALDWEEKTIKKVPNPILLRRPI